LDYLASAHLDGLYAHGSAGEFHCLEEWEFDRVNEALAVSCRSAQIPFQIGASHMSAQISLSRVARAVQWRPAAIQVVLPDWVPISMPESTDFLKRVADRAAGIPLVLYNPPQAKTRLLPAQFGQLADAIPNLIGIKVAGGDASWYQQMRQHAGGLALFVAGHTLATGRIHGARGAYSNVACLAPRMASKWYHQMQTDGAAALAVERRLQDFIHTYLAPLQHAGYSNAALDKVLAHVGGWSETGIRTRWPHRWVPEPEADRIRDLAQQVIPDLLD
jgi:dihydrodipicolinate synthase/N-acetylneuraminate lyase